MLSFDLHSDQNSNRKFDLKLTNFDKKKSKLNFICDVWIVIQIFALFL